jgi:hypothetical protein
MTRGHSTARTRAWQAKQTSENGSDVFPPFLAEHNPSDRAFNTLATILQAAMVIAQSEHSQTSTLLYSAFIWATLWLLIVVTYQQTSGMDEEDLKDECGNYLGPAVPDEDEMRMRMKGTIIWRRPTQQGSLLIQRSAAGVIQQNALSCSGRT